MENGKFYGAGFIPYTEETPDLDSVKTQLTPYPGNDYIRNLVYNHAQKFPSKILSF
jgi:DNA polymerase-3 subunit epsilon